MKKRDLRAELLAAEAEARNKKRKAEGKPPLEDDVTPRALIEGGVGEEDEVNKRRKLLQEALEMDKDDDDDEGKNGGSEKEEDKDDEDRSDPPFGPDAKVCLHSISEDESDDEDDTTELLRELEKIKRERAEEKARQDQEQNAQDSAAREAQIATANPLLDLAARLGQGNPNGVNTTAPGTFSVKRRWDDGRPRFHNF